LGSQPSTKLDQNETFIRPRQDWEKTETRPIQERTRPKKYQDNSKIEILKTLMTFMAYQWKIDAILILSTSIFNWDTLWPSVYFLSFLRFLSIDKRSLHFKTKVSVLLRPPCLALTFQALLSVSQTVMKTTLNLIKLNILTFGTTVVNRCNWLRNFVLDRIKNETLRMNEWTTICQRDFHHDFIFCIFASKKEWTTY
jgi:hypothetical protein